MPRSVGSDYKSINQSINQIPLVPRQGLVWDLQQISGKGWCDGEDAREVGRLDTVSSYLSSLGWVKRGEFKRALTNRTIILQKPSTFQLYILTTLMPSTARPSPAQEKPEYDDLIERYILAEKLLSPPSTLYKGAGR